MPHYDPKELTFQVLNDDGEEVGIVWFKDGFYFWEDKVNEPHTTNHRYDHPIHALATLYDRLIKQ